MLFQPSNIAPSTLSGFGIGTVDVTQGLDVSWQVNGDSPMTAYQITIYQNDSNSTQMYTTGQITLGTPFQTHDAQGNPQFFSTSIGAATLASAGIVNGYANGYKIIIKQWWSVNDSVEQTSAAVFITRTTPTLSIDAIPSPVTASSQSITASYAQTEGDPISTVEWVFALAGQEDSPIKETGAVNTQILSFTADGLISGNIYSIRCNVVTSNGMEVSTGFVQFSVSYPSSSISVNYQLAQMRNSSAVYLSWDAFGANVLEYPYEDTTKTTNGITFTVNGEGDVSASGTASADAYFKMAEGTLSDLGFSAGQKFLIVSGYSGAKLEVKETNSSNVVVATVTGSNPMQYIFPSTTNTLTISIVIPNGSVLSPAVTLTPMLYKQDDIVSLDNATINIDPIQDLHGYDSPWPAGGGKNKYDLASAFTEGEEVTTNGVTAKFSNGYLKITGTNNSGSPFNIIYKSISGTIGAGTYIGPLQKVGIRANVDGGGDSNYQLSFTAQTSVSLVAFYVVISADDANLNLNIPMMIVEGTTRPTIYYSYSNICPITGRTGVEVYRTGKNLLSYTPTWLNHSALNVVLDKTKATFLKGNTQYIFSFDFENATSWRIAAVVFDENGNRLYDSNIKYLGNELSSNGSGRYYVWGGNRSDKQTAITTIRDCYVMLFFSLGNVSASTVMTSPMLELGSTATTYTPYQGNTYSLDWTSEAGTVYGATLQYIGGGAWKLTVDRAEVDLGTLTWNQNSGAFYALLSDAKKNFDGLCSVYPHSSAGDVGVQEDKSWQSISGQGFAIWVKDSSYSTKEAFKTAMSGVQLVYELATPVEYTLSSEEITLLTQSDIWSDGGNITAIYTKNDGTQATLTGPIVTISDSMAKNIPTPVYVPAVNGVSVYRYTEGEPVLRHILDAENAATKVLDYFAPSQQKVSYLIVAHATTDLFMLTSQFTPVFWFYSILLCSKGGDGFYHVRNEYIFKYGVETGAVSNNNSPALQTNFTRYPTRQPIASLYKTGTLKGYIGKVSAQKVYSDSVSLQNAIYEISTSTLTKFLKTRKGETLLVECAAPIQMQTGDNMVQQPLVATVDWAEVGDCSEESVISVPSDSFWPL